MAEDRKGYKIREDHLGEIQIADEVVTIIAGLAATEVEGVSSMAENMTGLEVACVNVRIASVDMKTEKSK